MKNLSDPVSSKQTAKNRLLSICEPMTRGFFRDNSWRAVSQLFKAISALGGSVQVESTSYYDRDGSLAGKRWHLSVSACGFSFPAVLTADFGANVPGETEVYDLTLTV